MEVKGTLKYRKVQRTPQTGENAGKKKWYAAAVTDREVDFEGFVSHISDHGSPYSRGTIHGVLMDALDHLHTVDSTSGVRRTVVRDVGYESLEIHLAVGYRSGIPLFLTSVLAALWCTLQLTILQCSFLFHDIKILKG